MYRSKPIYIEGNRLVQYDDYGHEYTIMSPLTKKATPHKLSTKFWFRTRAYDRLSPWRKTGLEIIKLEREICTQQ